MLKLGEIDRIAGESIMLIDVMRECRNFFHNSSQIEYGKFAIQNGIIILNERYLIGQYIAVTGSILSSGIYLVNDDLITLDGAADEEFEGVVYGLSVPREFAALAKRIEEFAESSAGQTSNVVSASFGIQSQSFATDSTGAKMGWQSTFARELSKYRRYTPDIVI